MSYKEYIDSNGDLNKEWRDERGYLHREDGPAAILVCNDGSRYEEFWYRGVCKSKIGPAVIEYDSDGSILGEEYNDGEFYLGRDEDGFWALWDISDEEERKHASILKLLARYS